jgi:hypothetical protein
MSGPDEWLSPARVQKPAYNPVLAKLKKTGRAFARPVNLL